MKAQVPVHNPGLRILIVSNQVAGANGVVNPVLQRMMASLSKDPRVASADFAPFSKGNPLGTMRQIARAARSHDIIHVHFGGIYSFLVSSSVKSKYNNNVYPFFELPFSLGIYFGFIFPSTIKL